MIRKRFVIFCSICLLSACGSNDGGGGFVTAAPGTTSDQPSIYSLITLGKVMYDSTTTFRVTGKNLDKGVTVAATGACSSLTELSGNTSDSRSYSCVPNTVGSLDVTVSSTADNSELKKVSFSVPTPLVALSTSSGAITVELRPDKAPVTVNNFLRYVHENFYTNSIFHRVVKGFVVQGGGYDLNNQLLTTHDPIVLEPPSVTGLSNLQGTIAMARTTDLNSATSQFYFNVVDNLTLDQPAGQGYAVFGSVVSGMDTVTAISNVTVDTNNKPASNVSILYAVQTR